MSWAVGGVQWMLSWPVRKVSGEMVARVLWFLLRKLLRVRILCVCTGVSWGEWLMRGM